MKGSMTSASVVDEILEQEIEISVKPWQKAQLLAHGQDPGLSPGLQELVST